MLVRAETEVLQPPHPFAGLRRHWYGAILADPALAFTSYTSIQSTNPQSSRDLRRHYRCMSTEEVIALPVQDLVARSGCHLFLCTSPPNVERSVTIIKGWKFKFSTKAFTWVKLRRGFDMQQLRLTPLMEDDLHYGLGLTTRKGTEDVLLGRCGNCRRLTKDVREVILAPVREHSRKPDEIFIRIERYCAGPYLELFARTRRANWDAWGDQVNMFAGSDKSSPS
jgi:N6-adenosine-specific RNA methylase IME4